MMSKLMKRIVTVVLVISLTFIQILEFNNSVQVEAANHSQSEAVSWAKSQLGKGLDYDGIYGNQCVDLIAYYYQYLGVNTPGGNAEAYRYNTLPSGWSRVYSNPQAGDIAVWKPSYTYGEYVTGSAGHVGIVTGVSGSTITVVNQNFVGQSYCTSNSFPMEVIDCYVRPNWSNVSTTIKPTSCIVTLSSMEFSSNGSITISVKANNNPTKYIYSFAKYNVTCKSFESTSSSITIYPSEINVGPYASDTPAGDYEVYVKAENSAGSCISSRMSFKVCDKPTSCDVSLNQYSYTLEDTIKVSIQADSKTFTQPSKYVLTIYDSNNNVKKVLESTTNSINLSATSLGLGQYKYYVRASNVAGYYDSEYGEFSVLSKSDKLNTIDYSYVSNLNNPIIDSRDNVIYDRIYFGNYPQSDVTGIDKEPIKWRVLSVDGDDAFVMADRILDYQSIHEQTYGNVTWENASLRKWLNTTFFNNAFSQEEQTAIKDTKVTADEPPFPSDTYVSQGNSNGNDTMDKIYLLSNKEAINRNYGFMDIFNDWVKNGDYSKYIQSTEYAVSKGAIDGKWWTRTVECSGSSYTYTSFYWGTTNYTFKEGYSMYYTYISSAPVYCQGGIVPVLHINLSLAKDWKYAGTVEITETGEVIEKEVTDIETTEETTVASTTVEPITTTEPTTTLEQTTTLTPTTTAEPTTKVESTTTVAPPLTTTETTITIESTTTDNINKLSSPNGLVAVEDSRNDCQLYWQNVSDATLYNIYLNGEWISSTSSASFKIPNQYFVTNVDYIIEVSALNSTVESEKAKITYKSNKKNSDKTSEKLTTNKSSQGTVTATTNSKPSKVTLKKAKNVKGKKVILLWNKLKGISKYEIQYATNKKFTKSLKKTSAKSTASSKTIKKLKKKKVYYFRVRAYKLINGTKIYGAWSNVKKVKIKK